MGWFTRFGQPFRRNSSGQLSFARLVMTSLLALAPFHGATAHEDDVRAAEYVHLALAHEVHGRQDFRQQLLEAAVLVSPNYAPAHWHLGHVQVDGQWVPALQAQEMAAEDEALTRYSKLRDKALGDPRRELALAKLAQKEQWTDRADLHLTSVAMNSASPPRIRDEAARRLDLVNVGGTLLTEEEAERAQEVAERVEKAVETWRGRLEEWRQQIEAAGGRQRENALTEMAGVDDPDIIPVTEIFLRNSGALFGEQLVRVLKRFPQHDATRTLVRFAVLSPWENVRSLAIDALKQRPMHEYVPLLLDGLVAPIRSQFHLVRNPDASVHYKHIFVQRNAEGNHVAAREHLARPVTSRLLGSRFLGARLTRNVELWEARAEAYEKARVEMAFLAMDAMQFEQELFRRNIVVAKNNEPVLVALEQTTGERLGRDPADWQAWWQGYNEVPTRKPTYYEYQPTASTHVTYYQPVTSCFAAGTPVWTETGLVPIETIEIGERVLSKDPNSGELSYKVVLRATAFPPASPTVRVLVGGESIDMTRGHVVWIAEKGWRMAKELQPKDRLHGLEGILRVDATEHLPPELEVYNLVVADFNTYFVGKQGVLVHDITYRKPTRAAVPGLTWAAELGEVDRPATPSLPRQLHAALQQ